MIELDVTDYSDNWHYQEFDLYLALVRDCLITLHYQTPDDDNLDYWFMELLEHYQLAIHEKRIEPISIKIFESEHLANEWFETDEVGDYELNFLRGESHSAKEIFQVKDRKSVV